MLNSKKIQKEASALSGVGIVIIKELRDYLGSIRMKLLLLLIILTAAASLYGASSQIRHLVSEDPFLLLGLFTVSKAPVPPLVSFLGFLIPLAGIALGFDAINSEYSQKTLSRILSQPIYRDSLITGKAIAAVAAIAITLLALWLLILGSGMLLFGIPPTGEQVARAMMFYIMTVLYAGIWVVMAILFSVIFKQPATSALASLGLWLVITVFWPIAGSLIAQAAAQPGTLEYAKISHYISLLSPNTVYGESTLALLNPTTRTLGPVVFSQLEGAIMGNPLPLGISLLLIWPHFSGLTASILLLFAAAYVLFQRQEVRA